MLKKSSSILTVIPSLFFLLVSFFAYAEEIEITTYYPSPYGVYEELRAVKMAIGTDFVSPSNVTIPTNTGLIVQDNVGLGRDGSTFYPPTEQLHIFDGKIQMDYKPGATNADQLRNILEYGKLSIHTFSNPAHMPGSTLTDTTLGSTGYKYYKNSRAVITRMELDPYSYNHSGYDLGNFSPVLKLSWSASGGNGHATYMSAQNLFINTYRSELDGVDGAANIAVKGSAAFGSGFYTTPAYDSSNVQQYGLIVEGKVGFGTDAPSYDLDVTGSSRLSHYDSDGAGRYSRAIYSLSSDTQNKLVLSARPGGGNSSSSIEIRTKGLNSSANINGNAVVVKDNHHNSSKDPHTAVSARGIGINIYNGVEKHIEGLEVNGNALITNTEASEVAQLSLTDEHSSADYEPQLFIHNTYSARATGHGAGIEFKLDDLTSGSYAQGYRKAGIKAVASSNYAEDVDLTFLTGFGKTSSNKDYSEKMRITSTGKVAIGLDSPIEALHVQGNIFNGNNSTYSMISQGGVHLVRGNSAGANLYFHGETTSTSRIGLNFTRVNTRINRNYTSTDVVARFTRYGEFQTFFGAAKPGGGNWDSTSDARLKNINDQLDNSIDLIMSLKPKSFFWNDKAAELYNLDTKKINYGFLAQDLQKAIPEFVRPEDEHGYYFTNTSGLNAILVSAVQKLRTENNEQNKRIEKLNSLMLDLKAELQSLKNHKNKVNK